MPLPKPEDLAAGALSIVIFGPGHGESIVIRTADPGDPGGEPLWAVVDSVRKQEHRASTNPALELLKSCGARPSLVVLTHPHRDHTGGLNELIERSVDDSIVGGVAPLLDQPSPYAVPEDPDDLAAQTKAQTRLAHIAIRRAWQTPVRHWDLKHGGAVQQLGEWTISVVHPAQDDVNAEIRAIRSGKRPDFNNVSAALLFQKDDIRIMLGADGEAKAWTAVQQRESPADFRAATPVKVPHHGSLKAIHPVLLDRKAPANARLAVVTPFPSSGRLPRFEANQGASHILEACGAFSLTAMPSALVPVSTSPVTIAAIRTALSGDLFGDDPAFEVRDSQPAGTAALEAGERDPLSAWVHVAIDATGAVALSHGAHALRVSA